MKNGFIPPEGITTYTIFGQRLTRIMYIRNVSSSELAEHIYVSRSAVSGYRTGRRLPDAVRLRLISKYLKVSADYLLGLKDNPD